MKKILTILLTVMLLATMSGCAAFTSLIALGGDDTITENGYAEGFLGDTMSTAFFDFSINGAYLCDSWEGYTPSQSGYILLVAEATVKNTMTSSIPMYDTDFQLQWGQLEDENDDKWDLPVTYYGTEPVSDTQFPSKYELAINEERTGILLYELPAGYKDMSITYLEYFADDTEGDAFFVYFTAEDRTSGMVTPPLQEDAA